MRERKATGSDVRRRCRPSFFGMHERQFRRTPDPGYPFSIVRAALSKRLAAPSSRAAARSRILMVRSSM
jgi:hypothetical protein